MDNETILIQETQKKGLSLNALKYIAIAAMLIDHVAIVFLDDSTALFHILDAIGRTTAPIMVFAAVEGYHHTKDLKKYLTRLFVFALINYLPFMYLFYQYVQAASAERYFYDFLRPRRGSRRAYDPERFPENRRDSIADDPDSPDG